MVKLTTNQLLIGSDFKHFFSSTVPLNISIRPPHSNKALFSLFEVNLHDIFAFKRPDGDFNLGDLFGGIKVVS